MRLTSPTKSFVISHRLCFSLVVNIHLHLGFIWKESTEGVVDRTSQQNGTTKETAKWLGKEESPLDVDEWFDSMCLFVCSSVVLFLSCVERRILWWWKSSGISFFVLRFTSAAAAASSYFRYFHAYGAKWWARLEFRYSTCIGHTTPLFCCCFWIGFFLLLKFISLLFEHNIEYLNT